MHESLCWCYGLAFDRKFPLSYPFTLAGNSGEGLGGDFNWRRTLKLMTFYSII